MLKCKNRAKLYKDEINTGTLLIHFDAHDIVEHTSLKKLFYMIYIDRKEYTFAQLSMILNYDESTLRRHLKKINKYIEVFNTKRT